MQFPWSRFPAPVILFSFWPPTKQRMTPTITCKTGTGRDSERWLALTFCPGVTVEPYITSLATSLIHVWGLNGLHHYAIRNYGYNEFISRNSHPIPHIAKFDISYIMYGLNREFWCLTFGYGALVLWFWCTGGNWARNLQGTIPLYVHSLPSLSRHLIRRKTIKLLTFLREV